MADSFKMRAPNASANITINVDDSQLKNVLNTISRISKGKELSKYWMDQEKLIDKAANAAREFAYAYDTNTAEELIKTSNALKAMSGEVDLSTLVTQISDFNELLKDAKRYADEINDAFSINTFKEAFLTFDFAQKNLDDFENFFERLGNISKTEIDLEDTRRELEETSTKLRQFSTESGLKDIENTKNKLEHILHSSARNFRQFLGAYGISVDTDGIDNIMRKVERGELSISEAIRKVKTDYDYLLKELNGNGLNGEQFDQFSLKLNEVFSLLQEVSEKVNTLATDGVKLTNSLSSDSHVNKLIESLSKIEEHLSVIKSTFYDVGDGEEFNPLLSSIEKLIKKLDKLKQTVSSIGLNINIQSDNPENQAAINSAKSNLLSVYQNIAKQIGSSELSDSFAGAFREGSSGFIDFNQFNDVDIVLKQYEKHLDLLNKKFESAAKSANEFNKEIAEQNGTKFKEKKPDSWRNYVDSNTLRLLTGAKTTLTKTKNEVNIDDISSQDQLNGLFGKETDLTAVNQELGSISSYLLEIKDKNYSSVVVEAIKEQTDKLSEIIEQSLKLAIKSGTEVHQTDQYGGSNGNQIPLSTPSSDISEQQTASKHVSSDTEKITRELTEQDEEYSSILKKLNLEESKLIDIVKIQEKMHIGKDGKADVSYTLKDSAGSTETYGENSNGEKGQMLMYNYVSYDKKLETERKATDEKERQLEIEREILRIDAEEAKLEQARKDGTKQTEEEYARIAAANKEYEDFWLRQMSLQDKSGEIQTKLGLGEYDAEVNKLINSYNNWGVSIETTEVYISELQNALNALKADNINADERIAAEERFQNQLELTKNSVNDVKAEYANSQKVMALYSKMSNWISKNPSAKAFYGKEIKSMLDTIDKNARNLSNKELVKLSNRFSEITGKAAKFGLTGKDVFDSLKSRMKSLVVYLSSFASFYRIVSTIRSAITTIRELDDALVDLRKTTTMSMRDLSSFYLDANKSAKELGVTTKEVISQAAEWSRLGFSDKESATRMAEISSMFAAISPGMDTAKSTEGLVSIIKAFDKEVSTVKDDVVSKVNIIGNTMATTNEDIVEGLERSSAALSALGTSFEDSVALFATGQEILQNAESVGTAIRNMSLRIRGFDEETEEASEELENLNGKIVDLTKTANNRKGISVFADSTQQHYKSIVEYLREISKEWDNFSEKQQTSLLNDLFGKRGAQVGSAIIKNFDRVEFALTQMENSAGNADQEMEVIKDSISYKVNDLKETWTGLTQELLSRESIKEVVDTLVAVSEAFASIAKYVDPIASIVALGGIGFGYSVKKGDLEHFFEAPFTIADRKAIEEYNKQLDNLKTSLVENGKQLTNNRMMQEAMNNANVEFGKNAKDAIIAANGERVTLEGIETSSKAAAIGMTLLKTAMLTIATLAISATIKWFVNWLDDLIVTADELREKISNLNSEISTLNSEIESLRKKDDLTDAEKDRLENLERELAIKKEIAAMDEAELAHKELENGKYTGSTSSGNTTTTTIPIAGMVGNDGSATAEATKTMFNAAKIAFSTLFGYITGDNSYYTKAGVYAGSENAKGKLVLDNYTYAERNRNNNPQSKSAEKEYNKRKDELDAEYNSNIKKYEQYASDLETINKYLENEYLSATDRAQYEAQKASTEAQIEFIKQFVKGYAAAIHDPSKDIFAVVEEQLKQAQVEQQQKLSIDQYLSFTNNSSIRSDLIGLSQAGKLDKDTIKQYEHFNEVIEGMGITSDVTDEQLEKMIKTIESMAKKNPVDYLKTYGDDLGKLTDAYVAFKTGKRIDGDMLSELQDNFGYLKSYKDFEAEVLSGNKNLQDGFNAIATELAENILGTFKDVMDVTDGLTKANAKYYESELKLIGVKNAHEVVTTSLEGRLKLMNAVIADVIDANDSLSEESQNLSLDYDRLSDATYEQIDALVNEAEAAGVTVDALNMYKMSKMQAHNVSIENEKDVDALYDLASKAGIATAELKALAEAKRLSHEIDYWTSDTVVNNVDWFTRQTNIDRLKQQIDDIKVDVADELSTAFKNKYKYEVDTEIDFDGGKNVQDAIKSTKETIDWIEVAISRLERTITNLGKVVGNTWRNWTIRNNALAQEIARTTDEIVLQQNAYDGYMKKAESIGLSDFYKNLVRNGGLRIEDITDDTLKEQIQNYREWYEKALSCADAIDDLRDSLAQLAKSNFDNISTRFNEQMSIIQHSANMYNTFISQAESAGMIVSENYYKALSKNQEEQVKNLTSKYSELLSSFDEAVQTGTIQKYSSDWFDMVGQINEVEEALADAKNQLIQFEQTLQQLSWNVFDRMLNTTNDIVTEAQFINSLMEYYGNFDEYGNVTKYGEVTYGMLGQNYNVYMEQVKTYADEIEKIKREIETDPYDLELIDRLNDLIKAQQDAINSAIDEKKAIVDLAKEGYDKMLDSLQKLIDKRKEALNAEKDMYDYEKNINEQTKSIASYRKQLLAYAGDNSEEAKSTIQKLSVSLSDAEEKLREAEYEKWKSDQEQMLDQLYD